MQASVVPGALRLRLGAESTADLDQFVREASRTAAEDVMERATERFEHRLTAELGAVRLEMAREAGQLRAEIAASRADLIRWMFIFWSGQVLLTLGMFAAFMRT